MSDATLAARPVGEEWTVTRLVAEVERGGEVLTTLLAAQNRVVGRVVRSDVSTTKAKRSEAAKWSFVQFLSLS